MSNGGKLDYYSVAALGSVGLLSDIAGTVDASYVTDVWGRQVASAGSAVNAFGYAGREFNEDGTYYYRARYYDPRIGRFTSEDPAYYVGGLYLYVADDPVARRDPSGLGPTDAGACSSKQEDKCKPFKQGYACDNGKDPEHPGSCNVDPQVGQEKDQCAACHKCCNACYAYQRCLGGGPMVAGQQRQACDLTCNTDICWGA